MTKHYHKKGNRIIKYAYLLIISEIIESNNKGKPCWLDEGYENEAQRIHFTSEGHRCILAGVKCPPKEDGNLTGYLPLIVETKWENNDNQKVEVTLPISKIHIATLRKITCEVYDNLRDPEKDPDWLTIEMETVANFLDTHIND